jgi:hypothetical protein
MHLTYTVVANRRAGGTGDDMQKCLRMIANEPEITVRNVVGGAGDPSRLQIGGTPDAVDRLRQYFGKRLIIEQDRPLTLSN